MTFNTPADAEGMLDFAQMQGVWVDDRRLRINWAQGSMPEWKVRLAGLGERQGSPQAGLDGSFWDTHVGSTEQCRWQYRDVPGCMHV